MMLREAISLVAVICAGVLCLSCIKAAKSNVMPPTLVKQAFEVSASTESKDHPAEGWLEEGGDSYNRQLMNVAGPKTEKQAWKYSAGEDLSAGPVIDAQGTVYIGTKFGDLLAVDNNGSLLWRTDVESSSNERINTLLLYGDMVVCSTFSGKIVACQKDGTIKWTCDLAKSLKEQPLACTVGSMKGLSNVNVIVVCAHFGKILLLNDDGTIKKTIESYNNNHIVPVVIGNKIVAVGTDVGEITFINADSREEYVVTSITDDMPILVIDPLIKHLYVSSPGSVSCYDEDLQLLWSKQIDQECCLSCITTNGNFVFINTLKGSIIFTNRDGLVDWTYAVDGMIWNSPCVDADSTVFVGTHKGTIYAINNFGGLLWTDEIGANLVGLAFSPKGNLIVVAENGDVIAY